MVMNTFSGSPSGAGARDTADILRKAASAGPVYTAVPASRSLATSVRPLMTTAASAIDPLHFPFFYLVLAPVSGQPNSRLAATDDQSWISLGR